MSEQSEIEKLQLSIESLKADIKCLAFPSADELSHLACKKILVFSCGIVLSLTIITAAGLAFLGFSDKGHLIVKKFLLNQVVPELTSKVTDGIKTAVNEQMKNFSSHVQGAVESDVSGLITEAQNKMHFSRDKYLKKPFCKAMKEKLCKGLE